MNKQEDLQNKRDRLYDELRSLIPAANKLPSDVSDTINNDSTNDLSKAHDLKAFEIEYVGMDETVFASDSTTSGRVNSI